MQLIILEIKNYMLSKAQQSGGGFGELLEYTHHPELLKSVDTPQAFNPPV